MKNLDVWNFWGMSPLTSGSMINENRKMVFASSQNKVHSHLQLPTRLEQDKFEWSHSSRYSGTLKCQEYESCVHSQLKFIRVIWASVKIEQYYKGQSLQNF